MITLDHPSRVLAIDPGLSGAMAIVGRGELHVARDFKHLHQIACTVGLLARKNGPVDHIVIEHVHAMPGQGVSSMFNFGKATGTAYGVACIALMSAANSLGLPEEVSPQKWQNWFRTELNLPRPQPFDSRAIALRLVPSAERFLLRKKDHNTADAILLALWKLNHL